MKVSSIPVLFAIGWRSPGVFEVQNRILMKRIKYTSIMAVAGLVSLFGYANTSWLVYEIPTGLVYTGYANEGQVNVVNTLPDFSKSGHNSPNRFK